MIVITGASDGLGKEVAKLYREAGKTVVNISRRESEYADINICLSLREGPEIKSAAKQVLAIDQPLETFINCIGVFNGQEKFGEITEGEVKRLMSTNVNAPMLLTSLLIERIRKDETDILNVLSTAATKGNGRLPVYTASKWAERGYTKSLQDELKSTKCRVISFCPGGINTQSAQKHSSPERNVSTWMNPVAVAVLIKQLLDLPKSMEVSEIVINRN